MAQQGEIVVRDDTPITSPPTSPKRLLAEALRAQADREIYVEAMGKKMPYREYLAVMIWDMLTNGELIFADGRVLRIDNPKELFELFKLVMSHIDGPVGTNTEVQAQQTNVKVYIGIDLDRV